MSPRLRQLLLTLAGNSHSMPQTALAALPVVARDSFRVEHARFTHASGGGVNVAADKSDATSTAASSAMPSASAL